MVINDEASPQWYNLVTNVGYVMHNDATLHSCEQNYQHELIVQKGRAISPYAAKSSNARKKIVSFFF
jgi:hypothetical protein